MDDVSTKSGEKYKALKGRLWNQPRPRQILERLEQHRASPPMLETVAQTFVNGRHGEAEIRSAIYGELLRNRDRTTVLKRVADLRLCLMKIQQDLSHVARELHQLKVWEGHRVLGYEAWGECLEKELELSDQVARMLLLAEEQGDRATFDAFMRTLIKGYAVPQPPLPVK